MISFKNKVVLITGGSRGIGESCSRLFAEAGADVAFTFIKNTSRADKLINELSTKIPHIRVKGYKADLENESEIISVVERIIKDFGKIDFLVNNAGIWEYGEAANMTLENWERTMRINMTGTFLFTREVVKDMIKNKYGRIINISSTAGQRGEALHSHYAASKGAMISYTKSLSSELAQYNITVNSVAPGWVDTEMCDEVFADPEYKEKVRQGIPVGRIPLPEDIAGPVLFLASDLARHITGEILNVNGGSVLCG